MWRLAKSLEVLRNQVNVAYPNRSKVSDGTIGDTAHTASASDHNPNAAGVVCAIDLTHDPAHGFDAHALAERLRVNRHPSLKYIISNSRIAGAWTNWQWLPYRGSNPHSSHVHFSVGVGPDGSSVGDYDNTSNWNVMGSTNQGVKDVATAENIKAVWRNVLGREPDQRDIDQNVGGDLSKLLDTIAGSAEAREYRDELTKHAYRGYLRREPEPTAIQNARNQAVRPFFNAVANSQEAKDVAAKWTSGSGKTYKPVNKQLYEEA